MSNTTTESRTGLFIVFEGVEGAGKTTHLRRLSRRLDQLGIAHIVVREPGGTRVGERIRDIILDTDSELFPETEMLLLLAARAEFVRRVVRPALERGELVLGDRYELSTLAYQGAARGIGVDEARKVNAFATAGLRPDGTILLRVDPESGRRRQSDAADRMERESVAFHRAVADAYDELADTEPDVISIDSADSPEIVHDRIWHALSRRWPGRFPPANTGA